MLHTTYLRIVCLCLFTALFLGCTKQELPQNSKKKVIVSVSPYNTFVKDIAQDSLDITLAIPVGVDPHIFEATPRHMMSLKDAAIWIGIGEPSEKKIYKALKEYDPALTYVDLSQNLVEQHHDHVGCSHDHHDSIDRHFWMDPKLVVKQVHMIKEALIQLNPNLASEYEQRALELTKRLEQIDHFIQESLKPYKGDAILISHASMGYYCDSYHLKQISIECEGKSPLPQDLQKIIEETKRNKIRCLFIQKQFDNKGALIIGENLKIPTFEIDPHDPDYIHNLKVITSHIVNPKGSETPPL